MYGYDGISTQRIVAVVRGARKVIAWGDGVTGADLSPFIDEYGEVWVEDIADKAAESLEHPTYSGEC